MAKDTFVGVNATGFRVGLSIPQRSKSAGIGHLLQGRHKAPVLPRSQKNGCRCTVPGDDDLLAALGGSDESGQAPLSLFHADSCNHGNNPPMLEKYIHQYRL